MNLSEKATYGFDNGIKCNFMHLYKKTRGPAVIVNIVKEVLN